MAKYTVEDIEIIRQKSGISYEEAVNLLEYHNGSLARSLVDLEKNGRLKKSEAAAQSGKGIFNFLFRLRLKVSKNDVTVVNLSALFLLIALCVAPHLLLIALIMSLVLGYRIHMERNSREFEKDSFDTIVKNAKTNVQSTVTGFTSAFAHDGSAGASGASAQSHQSQGAQAPDAQTAQSYQAQTAQAYQQPPAQSDQPQTAQRSDSAPSGTRPVNVQFSEGMSADVKPDDDGYYEMDIK